VINSFVSDKRLRRCDIAAGCKADYTYFNESLNCRSCIDYLFVSDSSLVTKFNVIDEGSNLSDHLPIVCKCDNFIDANNMSQQCKNDSNEDMQTYLRWDHADLVSYYQLTGQHLQELLPLLVKLESDPAGQDERTAAAFRSDINNIYNKTVDILRNCANFTVPRRTKQFYKFWWNEELDCLKQQSMMIIGCG